MDIRLLNTISTWGPTQFEARTSDDRPVYVRYRSGWLTIDIGRPGRPGVTTLQTEFTVVEMEVDSLCGDLESITWEEVAALLPILDLDGRLAELEAQEREFRARWAELFKSIRTRDVPGVTFRTLKLDDEPWVTPYVNGVGKPEFERDLRACCREGVIAYSHVNPRSGAANVTVLLMPDAQYRWNAWDLAFQGPRQFDFDRLVWSEGLPSGESEEIDPSEVEAAFECIADRLTPSPHSPPSPASARAG